MSTHPVKFSKFVKAGVEGTQSPALPSSNLLGSAQDWQCQIDFRDNMVIFPPVIYISEARPDIVLWSLALKKVIMIELTCPSEENILQAKTRKSARYLPLVS